MPSRICKMIHDFQQKIIVYQGQLHILSAISVEESALILKFATVR